MRSLFEPADCHAASDTASIDVRFIDSPGRVPQCNAPGPFPNHFRYLKLNPNSTRQSFFDGTALVSSMDTFFIIPGRQSCCLPSWSGAAKIDWFAISTVKTLFKANTVKLKTLQTRIRSNQDPCRLTFRLFFVTPVRLRSGHWQTL